MNNTKKNILLISGALAATLLVAGIAIGVLVLTRGSTANPDNSPATQSTQIDATDPQVYITQADAAYATGDYAKAVTQLEKAANVYKQKKEQQKLDETNERIASIKALSSSQKTNEPTKEAPKAAPTPEQVNLLKSDGN